MFFYDFCVGISDSDDLSLLDHIELFVVGHKLDAAVLIADDALRSAVKLLSVVAKTTFDEFHLLNSKMHGHSGARFNIVDVDKFGF